MNDKDIELYVDSVKSNTSKLSEKSVHDSLVNFVRNEAIFGELMLKAFIPKREGLTAEAAGHKGPFDDGVNVVAAVGVPEVHREGESDPFSAKSPLFVDKGTGIFGGEGEIFAKDKNFMYIPPDRGIPGFLRSSKGQVGKHFMAATYFSMVEAMKINGELFKAELTSRLESDKLE